MTDKMHLARLKKGQNTFEVVIDSDLAMEFRKNQGVTLYEVLKSDKIFFDAKKGQEASSERLKALFETDSFEEIAKTIILEGEIQVSSEYREKQREEIRKKVVHAIHREGIDPKTGLPHPVTRIEAAIEEAKINIDEKKSPEEQISEISKKIRSVIPIKFVMKEIELQIPGEYAAKLYSTFSQFGKILSENWQNDGSWFGIIEIPGGLETDFYEKINSVCHGTATTKVVKTK